MSWSGAAFDVFLVLVVLWLAIRSLSSDDMFKSVVLFIVFGFTTALSWMRLGAPDIALADAVIGAGITGALLLDAFSHFEKHKHGVPSLTGAPTSSSGRNPSLVLNVFVTVASLGVFALLSRAVLSISEDEVGLAPLVAEKLHESGVESAVTAVLLNFRGYDTLLEIAVLVLAVIGVLSMRATGSSKGVSIVAPADPVMALMTRVLVPVMVLASGYLLWAGEHAPGGAFQAGSVLGAAGVLLALSGYRRPEWMTDFRIRLAISIGFVVFLAVAVLPMFLGGTLLEYPQPYAGALMLLIETWLTLSIGVILASLFLSSAAPMQSDVEGGEKL